MDHRCSAQSVTQVRGPMTRRNHARRRVLAGRNAAALVWPVVAMLWLLLIAGEALAQEGITVSQVDGSRFPEMVLYLEAPEGSGVDMSTVTKETLRVTEDGTEVEVLDFVGEGGPRPVDIVFVFDVTGSMDDEIDGVKEVAIDFADKLRAARRDFRLGLVGFDDSITTVQLPDNGLTADAEEFKSWISELRARGGGDDPEIALDALVRASEMSYREGAQKVLILITDAPPHESGDGSFLSSVTASEVSDRLSANGFAVYAVSYPGSVYESLSSASGGKFYVLSDEDFTAIINEIGGTIATQLRLSYLSPRPSFDGTRRDIRVTVGEVTVEGDYLEQHLLHIQSRPGTGLLLLAPVLAALLVPLAFRRAGTVRSAAAGVEGSAVYSAQATAPTLPYRPVAPPHIPSGADSSRPPAPPAVSVAVSPVSVSEQNFCDRCGRPLGAGAKFCKSCGAAVVVVAPVTPRCTGCGRELKPGTRFCPGCGTAQSGPA